MKSGLNIETVIENLESCPLHFIEYANNDIDIVERSMAFFEKEAKKLSSGLVFYQPVFLGYNQTIIEAHYLSIYSLFETLLQHTCLRLRNHFNFELKHTELGRSTFESCIRFLEITLGFNKDVLKSLMEEFNAYRFYRNKQIHLNGYLNVDIELRGKKWRSNTHIQKLESSGFSITENKELGYVKINLLNKEVLNDLSACLKNLLSVITEEIVVNLKS